ncbi:UNKNOWN [Stylonychia lemnae]|uniref:VWFA domain-containing protein n=1 Tax=Stylonychia lemnae TaxID=5949 RepID=A0A078A200_STYLE|nr:UNKNOWN [Stylonychia lemnae]|eukprot:CDW75827.1 UNKNOWN [Stylonychia lemnae]
MRYPTDVGDISMGFKGCQSNDGAYIDQSVTKLLVGTCNCPYVRVDEDCNIIDNRGIMIGTGLELTNRTQDELISLGIDKNLVNKIASFLGKKSDPVQFVKANRLELSDSDTEALDHTLLTQEILSLKSQYEQNMFNDEESYGKVDSKSKPAVDQLTIGTRTVLNALQKIYGTPAHNQQYLKLWNQALRSDYQSILDYIKSEDFIGEIVNRKYLSKILEYCIVQMAESQKTSLLFVLMGSTFKDGKTFGTMKDFLTSFVNSVQRSINYLSNEQSLRPDAKRIIYFITDTNHQDIIQTKKMADLIKLNVKFYALGLGSIISDDTLKLLTDANNQAFRFDGVASLSQSLYKLKVLSQTSPFQLNIDAKISTRQQNQGMQYYQLLSPLADQTYSDLQIQIDKSTSSDTTNFQVYYSKNFVIPNQYYNDKSIDPDSTTFQLKVREGYIGIMSKSSSQFETLNIEKQDYYSDSDCKSECSYCKTDKTCKYCNSGFKTDSAGGSVLFIILIVLLSLYIRKRRKRNLQWQLEDTTPLSRQLY